MANRVNAFPKREGVPKYPWKQWTDGSIWTVTKGKDYECESGSLVVYLYHKATMLDLNVQTSIQKGKGRKPDRVVFQFRQRRDGDSPVTKKQRPLKRKQA